LLIIVSGASADPGDRSAWTLSLSPDFTLPLVSGEFKPNDLFNAAGGGSFGVEYAPEFSYPLAMRLGTTYSSGGLLPSDGVEVPGTLTETAFLAGASTRLRLAERLALVGFVDAGLGYGTLTGGTSSAYGVARAGGGLDFSVTKSVSARLDAAALYKFGLYGGMGVSLGVAYRLPPSASAGQAADRRLLELVSLDLNSIFPIFRSYYDEHPVGTVTIANSGKKAATDVRVGLLIKQYMDAAKECAVIPRIEAGASVTVPVYGLFNDSILGVTEATKATAEVGIEYGDGAALSRTATVLVYDRNALTWADDRHAAAFISSKDPWVLDLSGNIVAAAKDALNAEVAGNLQHGIAFHEGLRAYGIGYVLSPNRPFAQAVVDKAAVDSLKFPRQTLGYRAGDCADLSVLYASFFEAAAIETALVTVPGHIFMAFDLGLTREEARKRSLDEREYIIADDRLWVPVETTVRSAGFLEAWRSAAGQWRDAQAKGLAGFYPVHGAWKTYPPVGLPADGSMVGAPDAAKVRTAFAAELAKVVSLELKARLAGLGVQPTTGAAKYLNSRGILYAKYGLYADADRDLKAAANERYSPAIVNLGNVAFIKADYMTAHDYYSQAAKMSPDNPRLLVNLATAAASLGRTDEVVATLERVRKLDSKIADQYASLAQASSPATRAANVGKGEVIWF